MTAILQLCVHPVKRLTNFVSAIKRVEEGEDIGADLRHNSRTVGIIVQLRNMSA